MAGSAAGARGNSCDALPVLAARYRAPVPEQRLVDDLHDHIRSELNDISTAGLDDAQDATTLAPGELGIYCLRHQSRLYAFLVLGFGSADPPDPDPELLTALARMVHDTIAELKE